MSLYVSQPHGSDYVGHDWCLMILWRWSMIWWLMRIDGNLSELSPWCWEWVGVGSELIFGVGSAWLTCSKWWWLILDADWWDMMGVESGDPRWFIDVQWCSLICCNPPQNPWKSVSRGRLNKSYLNIPDTSWYRFPSIQLIQLFTNCSILTVALCVCVCVSSASYLLVY